MTSTQKLLFVAHAAGLGLISAACGTESDPGTAFGRDAASSAPPNPSTDAVSSAPSSDGMPPNPTADSGAEDPSDGSRNEPSDATPTTDSALGVDALVSRDALGSRDAGTSSEGSPSEDGAVLPEPALRAESKTLCVLAGPGDTRAPGQEALSFYGTDLGFTYTHEGRLEILFGDSWSDARGTTIDPGILNDDASGFLDLERFPDGDAAERACEEGTGPAVLFDTRGENVTAGTDPDFLMDALKTPVAGFSNGSRQFALFYLAKPKGCVTNDDCDNGLECDPGLGFMLEEYFDERGITVFCTDGTLGCLQNTMVASSGMPVQDSGFCVDPTSSVATNDTGGRIASTAITLRMTVRDEANRSRFMGRDWLTTRFSNPAVTTVDRFTPNDPLERDYRPADGVAPGRERVFVWGRPRFAGVRARSRDLALYFAYADMPQADGSNEFSWSPRYFTHVDPSTGAPRFSSNERDAAPLDLSGGSGDPHEEHDLVNQMSVRWIEPLGRWVMFYGGGASRLGPNDLICPIIESLIGPLCDSEIDYGNGAVRMRTAKDPWGPWSPPVDVLAPGDPAAGPAAGSLYAPGGILHHPDCEGATCAPRTEYYPATEYGVLYAANIIDTWTEVRTDAVDLYWNVSTWNPYGVSLVRTRLR